MLALTNSSSELCLDMKFLYSPQWGNFLKPLRTEQKMLSYIKHYDDNVSDIIKFKINWVRRWWVWDIYMIRTNDDYISLTVYDVQINDLITDNPIINVIMNTVKRFNKLAKDKKKEKELFEFAKYDVVLKEPIKYYWEELKRDFLLLRQPTDPEA